MKTFILFINFFYTSSLLFAQDLQIGVATGGTFSSIRGDFGQQIDSRSIFGVSAGIQIEKEINQSFFLQPEINISSRGYKYLNNLHNTYSRQNLIFTDIPILVKYRLIDDFYILGGPQFSHLLNAWRDINLTNVYNFGIVGGVSDKFTEAIEVGIRYTYGITNIYRQIELDNHYIDFPTNNKNISSSPERFIIFFVRYTFFKKD